MGIYLNVGKDGFRESVASSIYVDKTGFIAETNMLLGTAKRKALNAMIEAQGYGPDALRERPRLRTENK